MRKRWTSRSRFRRNSTTFAGISAEPVPTCRRWRTRRTKICGARPRGGLHFCRACASFLQCSRRKPPACIDAVEDDVRTRHEQPALCAVRLADDEVRAGDVAAIKTCRTLEVLRSVPSNRGPSSLRGPRPEGAAPSDWECGDAGPHAASKMSEWRDSDRIPLAE